MNVEAETSAGAVSRTCTDGSTEPDDDDELEGRDTPGVESPGEESILDPAIDSVPKKMGRGVTTGKASLDAIIVALEEFDLAQ